MSCSIVFVHGLHGHPEKTWTYGSEDDKSTEQPRSSFFLRIHSRSPSGDPSPTPVFWPQALLSKNPKLAHTRILTWGYDSNVVNFFKVGNQQNISRHGHGLMVDLQQECKDDVGYQLRAFVLWICLTNSLAITSPSFCRTQLGRYFDQDSE
jgi:hypothetical protein